MNFKIILISCIFLTASKCYKDNSMNARMTSVGTQKLSETELNLFRYDNFIIEGRSPEKTFIQADNNVFLAETPINQSSSYLHKDNDLYTSNIAGLNYNREVTLELRTIENVTAQVRVKLHPEVKLFPVFVYIFLESGESIPNELSYNQVRSWFDSPLVYNTGNSISEVQKNLIPATQQFNVDDIFVGANIQFRLAGYETIVDESLAKEILGPIISSFPPAQYHAQHRDTPGIHIYFGKGSNLRNEFGRVEGFQCGIPFNKNRGIAINYLKFRDRRPAGLAHELGHYFGLKHMILNENEQSDSPCGPDLVPSATFRGTNLMINNTYIETGLSTAQRNLMESRACEYFRIWNLENLTNCE